MTLENGNGELREIARKILEAKRDYRARTTTVESDLRREYQAKLAEAESKLKTEYIERTVTALNEVFAEPTPAPVEEPKLEQAPKPEPEVEVKEPGICPECDAKVGPNDKFCSQCACPLKEDEKPGPQAVVSAGRKFSTRFR